MLICLDVAVSGFLLSVSPIKLSKEKVKYIHFLIRIQNTLHRGICFSAAKHDVHIYICTYLKLPASLVQIYLITEHHLYEIYLDSSLSGYLSEVSPVKLFKDKKKESISTSQSKIITLCIGVFVFPQRNMHCSMIFPKTITILE